MKSQYNVLLVDWPQAYRDRLGTSLFGISLDCSQTGPTDTLGVIRKMVFIDYNYYIPIGHLADDE